ncbi:MAG: 1-acyl-sn-glycerol-3-phosphate acyltransferase [Verrucomicrobiales bacterium]|nr:1-acyl-sn-glycerol-3-phosphate acyltransferase [Verrucomicrobiales bacterium]
MIAFLLTALARFVTGASNAQWMGCEPSPQQRIYFANHSSNLDALVIWAALPEALRKNTRPVAASDYWTKGKVRMFLAHKVFRAILIERKKITVHSNPIPQILTECKTAVPLLFFRKANGIPGMKLGNLRAVYSILRGVVHRQNWFRFAWKI